jgi:hypothetical protein
MRKRQPPKSKRHLAKLPKTEAGKLNVGWDEMNKHGMNVETVRATIASGTLKKALLRQLNRNCRGGGRTDTAHTQQR